MNGPWPSPAVGGRPWPLRCDFERDVTQQKTSITKGRHTTRRSIRQRPPHTHASVPGTGADQAVAIPGRWDGILNGTSRGKTPRNEWPYRDGPDEIPPPEKCKTFNAPCRSGQSPVLGLQPRLSQDRLSALPEPDTTRFLEVEEILTMRRATFSFQGISALAEQWRSGAETFSAQPPAFF